MGFRDQQVQFIDDNPAIASYDRRVKIAGDQQAQELANAANQANFFRTIAAAPVELQGAKTAAAKGALDLDTAQKTQQASIDTANSNAQRSGAEAQYSIRTLEPRVSEAASQAENAATGAKQSALNYDTSVKTQPYTVSTAASNAATAGANAQVATGTVGSRITESSNNAAKSTIDLQKDQAWKEQTFFEYAVKDPDYAEAWAKQNGYSVPGEVQGLIRNKRLMSIADGLWTALKEQYPGDENVLKRDQEFGRIIKQMNGNPNPTQLDAIQAIDTTGTPPAPKPDKSWTDVTIDGQPAKPDMSNVVGQRGPNGEWKPLSGPALTTLQKNAASLQLVPGTKRYMDFIASGGKSEAQGGGVWEGKGMDAQDSNIIQKGQSDPAYRATPEYAMAWWRQFQQPKLVTSQDPNDPTRTISQMVVTKPPAILKGPDTPVDPASLPPAAAPRAQPAQAPSNSPATVTPLQGTGQQKPLTSEQSLSQGFTDRMSNSGSIIDQVSGAGTDVLQAVLSSTPYVNNFLINSQRQQLEQAERDFVNAQLRRESGAAISPSEFENARLQYFPQPGDGPKVLAQKAINRQLAVRAMERNAGPAYPTAPNAPAAPIDPSKMSDDDIMKALNQ
jgi:hypothetical protein